MEPFYGRAYHFGYRKRKLKWMQRELSVQQNGIAGDGPSFTTINVIRYWQISLHTMKYLKDEGVEEQKDSKLENKN